MSKYAVLRVSGQSIVRVVIQAKADDARGDEVQCRPVSSSVEGVGLGLPVERLPFLVSHCTCRPSGLAARLMFLPASVRVGGDFPAAKTICQSGTPPHTLTHSCPAGRDGRPLRSLTLKGGPGGPCARAVGPLVPHLCTACQTDCLALTSNQPLRLVELFLNLVTTITNSNSLISSPTRPTQTHMTRLLFKHSQAHTVLFACHHPPRLMAHRLCRMHTVPR